MDLDFPESSINIALEIINHFLIFKIKARTFFQTLIIIRLTALGADEIAPVDSGCNLISPVSPLNSKNLLKKFIQNLLMPSESEGR